METNFQQQNFGQPQNTGPIYQQQEDLPNAGGILALGILSILFAGILGIILSIIALSMAGTARNRYEAQPDRYTESSWSRVKAGKVCAIIGLCLLGLVLLLVVVVAAAS